jgi:hypothetical protein
MPNTLAHLGVQTLITRSLDRQIELRWIFLGCVVPDLPWIANRVLAGLAPAIDLHALRPYWIVQASWIGSLALCGALALLASRPRRVFAVLAANAFLHLLLDGLQTKWGNGVHLVAPWSWKTWNAGWFWPESPITLLLTALGFGVALVGLARAGQAPLRLALPPRRRALLAVGCLAVYLTLPLAFTTAVVEADAHSLRTLGDPAGRAGQPVAFDRVWLERLGPDHGRIMVRNEEVLEVVGALPSRSGTVSARGTFRDARTVALRDVHPHDGLPRSLASYVGLTAVAALWAAQAVAGWRRPSAR